MATKDNTAAPMIFGKLADVMADVEVIGKNRNNTAQGFKFRGIDDAYNALHGPLSKHRVIYAATVIAQEHHIGTTKAGGTQYHTLVTVRYTFYAEDGSSVAFESIGEALDTGDKAAGKAQSYALKVALIQVFCIPTEEQQFEPDYAADERVAHPVSVDYATALHTALTLEALAAEWKRVPQTLAPALQAIATTTKLRLQQRAAATAYAAPAPADDSTQIRPTGKQQEVFMQWLNQQPGAKADKGQMLQAFMKLDAEEAEAELVSKLTVPA